MLTRNEPSKVLTETIEQLSMASQISSITRIVADAARQLTGADGTTFVLREDDLCYYADENAISPLWKGKKFPMGACISGWSMIHREVVTIDDIYLDQRIPHDAYRPTFVKSLCMVPIRAKNPVGAIGNYWSQTYTPSQEEIKLLQILANSSSIAIENLGLKKAIAEGQFQQQKASFSEDELENIFCALAHDLKNPIASMVGFAELIGVHSKTAWSNKATHYLDSITRTGFQANQQIEKILSLYRIKNKTLAKQKIHLSAIAEDIVEQLITHNPNRIVDFKIEPGLYAQADPHLMHLVLENLLSNALKYTQKKPAAVIELNRWKETPKSTSFFIRDNGDGFDSTQTNRLFKPLTRLHDDSEFPGHGLGLSSVARIIEMHGGKVHAEGKKLEGATFFVEVPN